MYYGVGRTNLGLVRQKNEDSFFVSNEQIGCFRSLYIVADGIGGSRAGEVASSGAVSFFREYIQENVNLAPEEALRNAAVYANTCVYNMSESSPEYRDMGTTLIAAAVFGDELLYLHVGDSRIYTIGNRSVKCLTVDHNLGNKMLQNGTITEDLVSILPNSLAITKWIGSPERPEPDIGIIKLEKGSYLLMCSDGLSNMVSDREMLAIISKNKGNDDKVEELIKAANANGGRDNITVILIHNIGVK